jgi:hypothetical protein
LHGSSLYTPALINAGDATFFAGDALMITGGALYFASPVIFVAAGATKITGGFTTSKTWCTHESAAGSLQLTD